MAELNPNQQIDLPEEQSGSNKGFYINDLADGTALEFETQHSNYRFSNLADTHVCIAGHFTFCPDPVEAEIDGSFRCGPILMSNPGFIGRGIYLLFKDPLFGWITTPQICGIHKLASPVS